MSFSSEVKKELSMVDVETCCMKAELYGILRYKSEIKIVNNFFGVSILTTLNVVARRIIYLFKKIYNLKIDLEAYQKQKLDYKIKYILNVNEEKIPFLKDLKVINDDNTINDSMNYDLLKKDCCKGSLFRGLFLVQGSINDPKSKDYHLEITINNEEDIPYLISVLEKVHISPKVIKRPKGNVMYLKKSEQIGDFLKFVGAITSLFKFEDKRIEKDYSNYVNRIINCDIYNEQKALSSATKQLENIKYLTEKKGIIDLTQRLLDAMMLRNKYPEYSLSELSSVSLETIGRNISKSGLNHCFKDIELMCKELRGEKK